MAITMIQRAILPLTFTLLAFLNPLTPVQAEFTNECTFCDKMYFFEDHFMRASCKRHDGTILISEIDLDQCIGWSDANGLIAVEQ